MPSRAAPNRPVLQVQAGTGGIVSFALAANGRIAAVGALGGNTSIWEVETGRVLRYLHLDGTNLVYDVALSADGKRLLTRMHDRDGTPDAPTHLSLWNVEAGTEIRRLNLTVPDIMRATLSPDGRFVLAAHKNGSMTLWDVAANRAARVLTGHAGLIFAIAFSPDSRFALSGGKDGTARIWNVATGREIRRLQGHTDAINAVAWAQNGARIATGSVDRSARVWEAAGGKEIWRIDDQPGAVEGIALSSDGTLLYTGNGAPAQRDANRPPARFRHVWDVAAGRELPPPQTQQPGLADSANQCRFAAFTPDGKSLFVGAQASEIVICNAGTGVKTGLLGSRAVGVTRLRFDSDRKTLLQVCAADLSVTLWDTQRGEAPKQGYTSLLALPVAEAVYAVSPNQQIIAVGGGLPDMKDFIQAALAKAKLRLRQPYDVNAVTLFDANTNAEIRRLPGHVKGVTALAFSADGKQLASGSGDQTCRIWDPATGGETRRLAGAFFGALAFTPDGRFLASTTGLSRLVFAAAEAKQLDLFGPAGLAVRLWDLQTGQETRRFIGSAGPGRSLAFSSDGKTLLAGGASDTALLWEVATGRERLRLRGHRNWIESVAFSPGRRFSPDGQHGLHRAYLGGGDRARTVQPGSL